MGIGSALHTFLFGHNGGLKHSDVLDLLERDNFSKYLPWVAYDAETREYRFLDDMAGFIWECAPVFFAGQNTINTLGGLFRQGLPEKAIMQFVLVAEPHVTPVLAGHKLSKKRNTPLIARTSDNLCSFFENGQKGMKQLGNIPLRNFRLFFTVKFPTNDAVKINMKELWLNLHEMLKGARVHPSPLEPEVLLDFTRRLFNDTTSDCNFSYDDAKEIRKQCIFAGTETTTSFEDIRFGKKIFKCITPQNFPTEVNAYQTNLLFGGVMGMATDGDQIKTPFIYSLNIIMRDQRKVLHTKCNFIIQQQSMGSMAPSLARKKNEYMQAVDQLERGTRFLRVQPTLWVYGEDEDQVTSSLVQAKRVWESQGYVMQVDKGIMAPLFISSLPGGLYDVGQKGKAINMFERDFTAPVDAISEVLPVQGDFAGFGEPVVPLIGRKGQLFGIDLWAHNSFSALVCATTGGGKSFLLNYILNNYYGVGAKIRVVDIGGSYKKMVGLHGARFIDFAPGNTLCLNPFTNVSNNPDEPEDTESDLQAIPGIIAQMCYSEGEGTPTATDMTLISQAVRWAWANFGKGAGANEVQEYLNNFAKYNTNGLGGESAVQRGKELAFNMTGFCEGGPYARYFNGPSTFNIKDDEFVVLELEHLEQQRPLFKVVTLQVVNAVTQDLYLGDRTQKKLIVFDEAWKFLSASSSIKTVIEEGYRRARKYNGSFTIITQSILDMIQFGSVGEVIQNNSAFKFYLQSGDFEKALDRKLIDYSPFVMDILKSLASNPPKYSEVFIDSPFGVGVGRLLVDRYNYYVNTSSPTEVQEMDNLLANGMAIEDVIDTMVEKYSKT